VWVGGLQSVTIAERSETVTVVEAIADELVAAGVDRVFGLPGGEVLALIEAIRSRGIEFVLCRHEADAGLMAAVYGKLSGRVGVVLTTLGPGAANLTLALANSLLDREPLLAISAATPTSWPLQHTHQRLPLLEMHRPLVKRAEAVNRFNVRRAVRGAIAACLEEPLGPAYLTVTAEDATQMSGAPLSNISNTIERPSLFSGDAAQTLRQKLAAAERPLVLLGLGMRSANAGRLRAWLDRWHLPVAVTPKVKGLVDETRPNFVGVVGGMSLDELMVEALQQSDLLIGLGMDPVELDKRWHAELPISWFLESPMATGILPSGDVHLCAHADLLDELSRQDAPRIWDDPFATIRERRRAVAERGTGNEQGDGTVAPTEIVRALAAIMPSNTIVTTDVGSHKYLFGQFWPNREPETFFMSNGLSGMGYGLPAAIGAKLARPDSPVLAAIGDGGFSMNSQELETAKRYGAEIIVVVLSDNSYSLIRHAQASRGLPQYGVDFAPIDTVRTAEACGFQAARVSTADELAERVSASVGRGEGLVVEVPVDVNDYRGLV